VFGAKGGAKAKGKVGAKPNAKGKLGDIAKLPEAGRVQAKQPLWKEALTFILGERMCYLR